MQFPQLMPPTLITRDKKAIEAFRAAHGEVVMKPLYGHGGSAVFKVDRKDSNFGSLYDLFAATFREPWVVQRFLPKVSEGDKRIILVEGVAAGAVNRIPARGRHPLEHGARRGGGCDAIHPARTGDLRNDRSGTKKARTRSRGN